MKHYIYLTEDKLYYIRKENRARGYSFMGSRTITGPETVTGAMESLADIYNLKGRAVVLAIEASVKIHFMSLPASSKKTALQMAEKQLLVLGEEGERLLAADFMPNNGQGMLKGTVYTVSEAWIRAIETGALITRFRIHSILPGPALLASFLEPSDYGMNKGTVIFVHLADQSIVFYQMENGHCRHLEHSSLKPGMFAYLGEEKALMEEVAVLIRRFQIRMKQERREFQIQGVLIQGECLKAPRSDAGVLAKMLGIPCMALGKITEAGFPLGPVCASLVAFAVIVLSALGGQFYTAGKLERLDRISADQQGNDVTQERRDLEGKISELAKLTAEKRELAGQITLDPAVFSCLEQALLPEMDLETIEYQAEDASIHLKLSTSKPEQVSLFCEKIEENSGFSLQQSHWQQQEDKVSAALVFTIGKGAKDEAQ